MKTQNIEQRMLASLRDSKLEVQEGLFKAFCIAQDDEQRLEIGSMMKVLDKLTFKLTNSIKEQDNG